MASRSDEKLLASAQKIVEKKFGGVWPSVNALAKELRCRKQTAARLKREGEASAVTIDISAPTTPSQAPPTSDGKAVLTETDDTAGDKRTITKPRTTIRTLEELIEVCKIDLTVWHVDRFVANKWEMGFIEEVNRIEEIAPVESEDGNEQPADKETLPKAKHVDIYKTSGTQSLYQVKAFLSRRPTTPQGESILDETGYINEIARLRSTLAKKDHETRKEKQISKRLALNHMGADDFLNNVKDFMQKFGDFSLPYKKPEAHAPLVVPAVGKGHTEDAVMLLSDTHFGDRIKREDTAGFPEFDLPISGNRFGYVIGKEKQVLTLHRAMYPIDTLYVWVGGDIGNGILHDSPNSNELFTPAQVHFSYHMLKFGIEDLLTLTLPDANGNKIVNRIKLLFTVGNHMRMDEKMPHKFQAQRTLDWLIYQFVIEKFKGNPNIDIRTEMSPYIFESIRGHRHLFAHGMQVGYRNSPDAQCKSMGSFIDRVRALFDSPEWRRQNSLMGETFAKICIGDIHVPVSFPRLLSNGSLNGQNELGVNWVMEPIPAGQQLFGVSENHLETWKYFLDCTHVQDRPSDRNSYGDFAREYAHDLGR